MIQARSNFVTPAGLILLAATALLSAYLGIGLLFALLAGLFLVCLVSWLWTRRSLRSIKLATQSSEICGYPGDDLNVDINVKNDKLLPLVWLRAAFPVGDDACVKLQESEAAVFSWVMPHQELSWTDPYKALRRGVFSVPAAEISSGDGFGLSEAAKEQALDEPLRFVVFPALLDIDVSFFLSRLTELEPSKNGFYTDPTLLKSVRDITPSDSMRNINWRILAKEGKLQVNVREKLDTLRICLALDLESYSVTEEVELATGPVKIFHADERLEKSISALASAAAELSARGVKCSLAVPGYKLTAKGDRPETDRSARVLACTDEADDARQLLTALAEIDYEGGPAVLPLEEIAAESHILGQVFCFSLKRSEAAAKMEDASGRSVWSIVTEGPAEGRCIKETELLL